MFRSDVPIALPLDSFLEFLEPRLEEARAGLQEGRVLPAIRQATSVEALARNQGWAVQRQLADRPAGLKAETEQVLNELDRQFTLTLFPNPYIEGLRTRADIYVPGRHGYSVVEIAVPPTRVLAACDLRIRDGGRLSAAELQEAGTRTLNVTGGLLSKRGREPTAPILGYDVAEALAPIAANKYLRRLGV